MPSGTSTPWTRSATIAAALDAAGVAAIEVAHGDGLAGSSVNYGFGTRTDREWIAAAAEVRQERQADHAAAARDRRPSRPQGARKTSACRACASPPTAPRPTSPRSTSRWARENGMDVGGFLMMSHMNEPRAAGQAGQADGVVRRALRLRRPTPAGALLMRDVAERVDASPQVLEPDDADRGIHAHHNLSLGVANCVVAVEHGTYAGRRLAGRAWAPGPATRRWRSSSPAPT